jgi:hypothetical protein
MHYYNDGFSAEMLACEYPSLSLAEIHKVIVFYSENRVDVESYIAGCESQIDEQRSSAKTGTCESIRNHKCASDPCTA